MKPTFRLVTLISCAILFHTSSARCERVMERLDRGVVAVRQEAQGTYIGWRLLGADSPDVAFNVYRDGVKLNETPLRDSTNFIDPKGAPESSYTVRAVVGGKELADSKPVKAWPQQYLEIPLTPPTSGALPSGEEYSYSPGDASVGDLDGDGEYEIVLKWEGASQDSARGGYTSPVILEGLKLDGTSLWKINLGHNIRAGAHYTQFIVYDLDSNGKAEVACRTADGAYDGRGMVIGDPSADYRDEGGRINTGPEFLTIFDGETGVELASAPYEPARGNVMDWGDGYGNRCDRHLACVAYLDGERPSLIMGRGYYGGQGGNNAKNAVSAWNWRDGQLTNIWNFVANNEQNKEYVGQGSHSIAAGDVDGDGKDEIMYGACAIDDNGAGLYSTRLGHGDAHHFGDLDPSHPGLEFYMPHEYANAGGSPGVSFRDAGTGEVLWSIPVDRRADVGRGVAADISAEHPGVECWAAKGLGLFDCKGENIGPKPSSINFLIWWDADPLRELLDGNWIGKFAPGEEHNTRMLLVAEECESNNWTKATPCLSADILGDWREEVIWRTKDNAHLRIYTTTDLTGMRLPTLMHDPIYRMSIAWQNVAYNQPPHTGFFLGDGMTPPPWPKIVCPGK
ncbi:rhamnogalacturonan lyase [Candidatus Sumerlaeota bacterium]|nr:rhamnogalacturonan lyase [Candidatus Sumerlaeota bacterium]